MKSSTYALVLGLGLAAVAMVPLVGGAIAQSPPLPETEQRYEAPRDRGLDDEERREFSQRPNQPPNQPPSQRDQRDFRDEERGRWRSDENLDRRSRHTRLHRGNRRGGRFLRRFDANGDGKVTRIEFSEIVKRRFERLDLNRDGSVSSEELANRPRRRRHWR